MNRREFSKLSIKLKNEVTEDNLKDFKHLMKDDFGAGELEQMRDFLDVWNALERTGRIAPCRLQYLISNFEDVSKAYNIRNILHKAMGFAGNVKDDGGFTYTKHKPIHKPQQPAEEPETIIIPASPEYVPSPRLDHFFRDSIYDCQQLRNSGKMMKNRGIMLIINQFKTDRCGTEEDVTALKNLFEHELDFHVDLREDQTKANVLAALKDKVRMMKDNWVERFFCVILSHGDKNGLWCTNRSGSKDQQISLETEILPMFRADKLPNMRDRPKVFIVQACRGLDYHKGVTVCDANPDEDATPLKTSPKTPTTPEAEIMNPLFIPNEADFLVAYPQTEGYRSFRDTAEGSWFIQTLVKVFQACYKEHDLLSMLTEVNYQVSKMSVVTRKGSTFDTPNLQMPCFMSSLRKKLFLT